MRHLWSLLAGVLAAPLAWGLIAVGQARSQQTVTGWVDSRTFDTTNLIEPASYLAVAGILLGLIATLRISPLGPLVGGVLLSGVYAGMFVKPLDVRNAVPDTWELFNRHIPLRGPLDNGTLLLVGLLLLVAMFSGQRWRRWPTPAADLFPDDSTAGADTATMPTTELLYPGGALGTDDAGLDAPRSGTAGSGLHTDASTESGQGEPEPAVARLGSTDGSAAPPPLAEGTPAADVPPPLPVRPVPARASEPQPSEATAPQPSEPSASPSPGAGAGEAGTEPPGGGKPATASEPLRRPPNQSGPPPTESPWAAPPRATRSDQD
jgi:hypothetical protein